MKNKLLVCFKPIAAVEAEEDLSVNSTTSRSSTLRKSKSLIIKSNTKLVDDQEPMKIKRKETNRSISGSFVLDLSLKGEVVPTMDLRLDEDDCMNMRIKQSLSEASLKLPSSSSFDQEELQRGRSIKKNPDKKGEGCSISRQKKKMKKKKMMGAGAESRPRSGWVVYLILVISLLTTVFYGRVCSVFVTSSSSCIFLCLPRWKRKISLRIRSN